MASQITSLTIVYSTVHSGADPRKHQSSASLAFVRGIHRWPVNSPHKGPATRRMFPFDDVIILWSVTNLCRRYRHNGNQRPRRYVHNCQIGKTLPNVHPDQKWYRPRYVCCITYMWVFIQKRIPREENWSQKLHNFRWYPEWCIGTGIYTSWLYNYRLFTLDVFGRIARYADNFMPYVCTWWRLDMEKFSALHALCEGNPEVIVVDSDNGDKYGALLFSFMLKI